MSPLLAVVPAHGVGARSDLPLPFGYVLVGAGLAIAVSFLAVGVLWRRPRLAPGDGWPLPAPVAAALDSPPLRATVAALGLTVTAVTLAALVAGRDNANNPAPYVVFVHLWVGLALLSLLLGPVWALVSPLRWLHRGLLVAARVDPSYALSSARPGYWPAAAGLLAFVWLELVAEDRTTLPVLRAWVAAYLLVWLLLLLVLGRDAAREGEPFEVWSRLHGSLSPLGRRTDGRWVLRTPLHGPAALPQQRGLLATCSVMLGSTAYDGFSNETSWYTFVQSSSVPAVWWQTLALVGMCALVAALLAVAAVASAALSGVRWRGLTSQFAPSLVPIAAGYLVAHYWSLFVVEGVGGLRRLSDPLGTGADLLGLGGLRPPVALLAPSLVAGIQLVSIVIGHVLGVVVAHERAVRLFDARTAALGQLPLVAVMIAYTLGGLSLLFSA